MDDTLKRLLDADREANKRVEEARRKRERIVEEAREKALKAEAGFAHRGEEILRSHLHKAQQRADQTIEDLERGYDLRARELHLAAMKNEKAAVEAAMGIIVDGDKA